MAEEVVVVGAGFGGINSALLLARKGFDVTVLDQRSHHEYTPGIIDRIRDRVSADSNQLELSKFFKRAPLTFSREAVLGIDPERKVVETNSGAHEYDYLVLGLGAEPRTFGLDISSIHTCYSLEEVEKIREDVEEGAEEAIVVGAGYVGIEIGTELERAGLDVTIVDGSTRPAANSNETASDYILDHLNDRDIAFRGGQRVTDISENSVELENGTQLEADMVVWAGGVQASKLVQEAFNTDEKGLNVNSGLCSKKYDDVFAVGDCADLGLKTAHNAMKQAETVAKNVEKSENQPLESYEEETNPLVISLGDTAVFEYGEKAYKSFLLRYLKDLVRWRYWFILKKRKLFSLV